jgi:AraC-like DNA-binding protein
MTYQIAHLKLTRSSPKSRLAELFYEAQGPENFSVRSADASGAFSLSVQAFNNFFTWQGSTEIERTIAMSSTREDFVFKAASKGQNVVRLGKQDIVISPSHGCIIKQNQHKSAELEANSAAYGFGISRQVIVDALQKLHGVPMPIGFEFEPIVDMSAPYIPTLQNMMHLFQEDAREHRSLTTSPVALNLFEEAISIFVIQNLRHSLSHISDAAHRSIAPAQVRRAMEFAIANAAQPITVADMAAAAGVSVRALQVNFQRFVERSPLEFLREQRLRLVHAELVAAGPENSVSQIAEKWGFLHPGRFAALYRSVYGKFPSEDLAAERK